MYGFSYQKRNRKAEIEYEANTIIECAEKYQVTRSLD